MTKRAIGVVLIFTLLLTVLPVDKSLYASGPMIIYDFDNYKAGESAIDLGIVTLGGEEGLKVDLNPVINADVSKTRESGSSRVATGWGKSLEITIGKWSLGDTWQPLWLNIPENKQNWSSYRFFGFWWNNQLCVSQDIGAFIIMFEDKDEELWGWKIPVQNSWSYIQTSSEGKISLHWAGSDWQGFGHTNWYGNYVSVKLDKEFFELKGGAEGGNGKFDLDQIKRVLILVDCGPIGIREGDKMYFDDFFLAKTMVVANNKYLVDGLDIANRNEGKEPQATPTNAPANTPTNTPTTQATPQPTPTNLPTSAITPGDDSDLESPTDSNGDTDSEVTSESDTSDSETKSSVDEVTTGEETQPTSSEEPNGEGRKLNIPLVIIIVVIVLGGAATAFYFYKKRKITTD